MSSVECRVSSGTMSSGTMSSGTIERLRSGCCRTRIKPRLGRIEDSALQRGGSVIEYRAMEFEIKGSE